MGIRKIVLTCLLQGGMIGMLNAETILQGAKADRQVNGADMVRFSDRSSAPAFIRLRSGSEVDLQYGERWLRHALNLEDLDGFEIRSSEEDGLGYVHHRLTQVYMGIPVEGGEYILHTRQGKITMANGDYFPLGQLDVQADLAEATALQLALAHVNAATYQWQSEIAESMLRTETGNPLATFYPKGELVLAPLHGGVNEDNYRLAWKFDIYAQSPLSRSYVYIDAQNGNVIWERNRIHTVDVQGTAQTGYSGVRAITTDSTGPGMYRLRETGRGNGIETFDMNQGTNYGSAADFTDSDNNWMNANAQLDEYATDAHWGAEMTYDYFLSQHNRNSINNNGFALRSYVHYDNSYANAFWDGQRMTYGDGNGGTFSPLTAIDVTGHEIAHGLTEFTANLIYQNESGALNESFSDVFGAAIEHFARPNQWSWTIGEDMTASGNGIRNMSNPTLFGDPDTYLGPDWYTGAGDNGGVHINSGVQNFWFYLLVTGGNGTNAIGNNYSVPSIGWVKAGEVAFRNLTVYLTASSDYNDARFFGIQSAIDLYGPCTPEVDAVTSAWYAVGVGTPYVNAVIADFAASPNSFCEAPATVNFANLSTNGTSFEWDFGDGSTSSQASPTHTYTSLGAYTVTLITDGGSCGRDTTVFAQYVDIDTANACQVTLNPNGNSTQTACNGILFDTGGPNGNYGDNENTTITIAPTGAASVTLTFASFNFEDTYDFLNIYDGPSASSPLIGSYTGNNLPNGGSITSSSGAITLVQTSDVFVTESGFEAGWLCSLPSAPPVPDFTADDTAPCDGLVYFTDLSTNGATSWAWDFGDGASSTQQNPSHNYASNGTYTVQLIATNAVGSDSIVRTAYINVSRPAGPLAPGVNLCNASSATLNASGSGGDISWYDAPNGGTLLATGNTYTTPVLSASATYYAIEEIAAAPQNVGPLNGTSIGGGGYHNNQSTQYLEFSAFSPMTLVSVFVDPGDAGNRTITLWNSQGQFIRDTSIFIPANPGRIDIGWEIAAGDYQIGGTQMDLFRNNNGPSYPYQISNLVSITGSSAGNQYYYYLYNWEVQEPGCISEPTQVDVGIFTPPTAALSSTNGNEICAGDSTMLVASGGTSYLWSTGDTSLMIPVTTSGTYSVTVYGAGGCTDTANTAVTVFAAPSADFTSVSNQLTVDFTDQSTGATTWAWNFGDGNSSTTQNPQYQYAASGTYQVTLTVTNADGCVDEISYEVEVIVVGINDAVEDAFSRLDVYPNPFTANLNLALELPKGGELKIEAVDLLGKQVLPVFQGKVPAGAFEWTWSPENLAEGSYILRLELNDRVAYRKLVHLR